MAVAVLPGGRTRECAVRGDLELAPKGCEAAGWCTLKNSLRFTNAAHVVWEAAAGLKTDGASIPKFFQPFVGDPFSKGFIKAALVHNHYCNRHVHPWRQTHRVFYEGLLNQGISRVKAKVMYHAVYLAGPKWVELIPGKFCGKNCVNSITNLNSLPVINLREAEYQQFNMDTELAAVERELEASGDSLSLEDLERRAQGRRPADYYYRNGNTVRVNDNGIRE